MRIFVAIATYLLIFEEKFNKEQCNYENQKRNKNPDNTFIIFFVQFFVFSIRKGDNCHKSNKKQSCKNNLSCTEHILYFYAKLNQN